MPKTSFLIKKKIFVYIPV